jgi:hypothetical protein
MKQRVENYLDQLTRGKERCVLKSETQDSPQGLWRIDFHRKFYFTIEDDNSTIGLILFSEKKRVHRPIFRAEQQQTALCI